MYTPPDITKQMKWKQEQVLNHWKQVLSAKVYKELAQYVQASNANPKCDEPHKILIGSNITQFVLNYPQWVIDETLQGRIKRGFDYE